SAHGAQLDPSEAGALVVAGGLGRHRCGVDALAYAHLLECASEIAICAITVEVAALPGRAACVVHGDRNPAMAGPHLPLRRNASRIDCGMATRAASVVGRGG